VTPQTRDRAPLAEAYPTIRDTGDYVLRHVPPMGPAASPVTEPAGASGAYRSGIGDSPERGRFGCGLTAAPRDNVVGIEDSRAVSEVCFGHSSFHPVADSGAQPR
jgi:hypothetical protein